MITRIEIDGFKTFDKFKIDLNPFMVIIGPNASGKSNLFDSIRLLSKLASNDIKTAVTDLRGDPLDLFRRTTESEPCTCIRLYAEVLLNPMVKDSWGKEVKLKHTRFRYEIHIKRSEPNKGIERITVAHESATPILGKEDRISEYVSRDFAKTHLKYSRRMPLLSTDFDDNGKPTFKISQDTTQGRSRSATAAEASVLSSITSAEFPHLFAIREEMRSWKFLQLDPASLRKPSPFTAPETLLSDGSNLATVLARIKAETGSIERPKGQLNDIVAGLRSIIPSVLDIDVIDDRPRREYRVEVLQDEEKAFSAKVLSDGTLRVLALLTLQNDLAHRGVVCFEEPENGIHPSRLKSLVRSLRNSVSSFDLSEDEFCEEGEALSQIIMNSHSPVAVSELKDSEMVFAEMVEEIDSKNEKRNTKTVMKPIRAIDQTSVFQDEPNSSITRYKVQDFLAHGTKTSSY